LANKDNWKKYPKAMLRARAVSEMARTLFPDIIAGCGHTPDEIQDTIEVPAKVTMADREAIAADLEKKAKLKAIEEFDKHLEHLTMNLGVTREEICKRLNIDEINVVTSWSSEQIQNSIDELFDMTREQPKVNTIEDPQSGPVGKSYDAIRAILRQNKLKQKTIDTLDKLLQKKLLDEDQLDIINGTRSAEKDDFTTFDYLMKNREDI